MFIKLTSGPVSQFVRREIDIRFRSALSSDHVSDHALPVPCCLITLCVKAQFNGTILGVDIVK